MSLTFFIIDIVEWTFKFAVTAVILCGEVIVCYTVSSL